MITCNLLFSFVLLPRLCATFPEFTITQSLLSHLAAPVLSYPPINGFLFAVKAFQTLHPSAPLLPLAKLQHALQNGDTPTMIAGFAMIIAQMQAQAAYPEVLLTITSSVRPLERSATFRDGAWQVYDLTHNLIDPRSHMIYGGPPRPPMDQERSLRVSPPTMQPPIPVPPLPQPQIPAPPLQVELTRFSCTLPVVPPPILTPPMPLASEGVRLLTHPSSNFMLPSTFQGGGAQVSTTANNPTAAKEQIREVRDTRTVTFQDSCDELTPSSSRSEPPKIEPSRLVGFQKDPKLQERQRQ